MHILGIVAPPVFFDMDAPSTGCVAQWVGVAGCSDWLQGEVSFVRGIKDQTLTGPTMGFSMGNHYAGCSDGVKLILIIFHW